MEPEPDLRTRPAPSGDRGTRPAARPWVGRVAAAARIDPAGGHPAPSTGKVVLAGACSVAASLVADALLVAGGTSAFPSTSGYPHFRFVDYAALTVLGVAVAAAAWPLVARSSASPRWLYLRLAVVVTVLLWVPDLYLLARHQPGRAVVVLMAMHVAVALVTYNVMVRVAPPRDRGPVPEQVSGSVADADRSARRAAVWLCILVGVELALGIATLVAVPTGRPTGLVPTEGRAVFLMHALVGVPLALGATALWLGHRRGGRMMRLCVWIGGVGVGVASLGGLVAASHPLRLVGAALMLVGSLAAGFGYLLPTFDALDGGPSEGP